jgi:hypothetical protein
MTTRPWDPEGPHQLPLSEQQRRHVVRGRRLGESTEVCTVVVLWDPARQHWVFYVHSSPRFAASVSSADAQAAARHILGSAKPAPEFPPEPTAF